MRYYLQSTDADRRIDHFSNFQKGVWVEVPKRLWLEFASQPGWEGRQVNT